MYRFHNDSDQGATMSIKLALMVLNDSGTMQYSRCSIQAVRL
jgi:hypothetical protein